MNQPDSTFVFSRILPCLVDLVRLTNARFQSQVFVTSNSVVNDSRLNRVCLNSRNVLLYVYIIDKCNSELVSYIIIHNRKI